MSSLVSGQPDLDPLYVAALPDPQLQGLLVALGEALLRRHRLDGQVHAAERMHVSVFGVGYHSHFSRDELAAIRRAMRTIEAQPFVIGFDRAVRFGRGETGPLVLQCCEGSGDLEALNQAFGRALAWAGVRPRRQPRLNPHLTLMYRCGPMPDVVLDRPIRWVVRDLALIHGLYGRARHDHLARIDLRNG